MSIFGIGQGQAQPAQNDSANADSTLQAALQRARSVVPSPSTSDAQALGSRRQQYDQGANTGGGNGSNNSKFGRQALNSSGRGQIVNIIV